MPVMARKQGSHSETTGPRVRDAALKLIARHGYAAVSMRQIAAEVGVQAGALYNYIADKQALLFDLMVGHMRGLLAALETEKLSDDPVTALDDFTRFHLSYHLPRRDEVFVSYMELRNLDAENFQQVEALRRTYEDQLEAILRRGVDTGVFDVRDTRVATLGLIALLTGVTNWFDPEGRLGADAVIEIYQELVRKSVAV